jgi:hypothetical protein
MKILGKCVYCGGDGPFNREHIFSVALGGDDSGYILEGEVCAVCNSRFSVLEGSLFREHILGFMRFADHYIAGRSGKPPTVNARLKMVFDEYPEGLYCEGSSIDSQPASQIIIRGDLWVFNLSKSHSVGDFFNALESAFCKDNLTVVKKVPGKSGAKIFSLSYRRLGENFDLMSKGFIQKPPKGSVWLECSSQRRVLINNAGGVLIQIGEEDDLSDFLRLTHRFISNAERNANGRDLSFQSANVSHAGLPDDGYRALAKIAVNVTVKCAGVDFVNQPEFTPIKDFVMGVRPKLDRVKFVCDLMQPEIKDLVSVCFGDVPNGLHVFWLAIEEDEAGSCDVTLSAWLYNSCYVVVALAGKTLPPDFSKVLPHTFFVIDHQKNDVATYAWSEYDQLFGVTQKVNGRPRGFGNFSLGTIDVG